MKKIRLFFNKITKKYKLVFLSADSLEERFSFITNRLYLFYVFLCLFIISCAFCFVLFLFTPISSYFNTTDNTVDKKDFTYLMGELDSLEVVIDMQYQYINNLRSIIGGEVDFIQPNLIVEKDNFSPNIINLNNTISVADSTLRIYVEHEEDVLNLFNFITPTSGFVTDTFNITEKHYGIDVATNELEKIYSILDGAVLISGKNLDFGNFLIISHPENLMSIYMHASSFTKTSGDSVYSGDLIGFTGNTGALSNGTHLHFELRYNGVPINPKKYIAF